MIVPISVGIMLAKKSTEKYRQAELVYNAIAEIEALITYQAMTVSDIFEAVFSNERYKCLNFDVFNNCESNIYSEKISYIFLKNDSLLLEKEYISELKAFFLSLGKGDIESQQKICRLYIEKFENYSKTLREKTVKDAKMYRSLGVLFSIFVAILFI